jgi:hypothetical protein
MMTEKLFVSNAIKGLILSLVFASVVLLIATHNVVVTLFSVFMFDSHVVEPKYYHQVVR